mmetsp:Transcript_35806/g.111770  ORF Transcript_35806/g.111770 Transcript_35806/m.111770 type:complete len:208 (+) Transcript_35806:86-709(+)
MGRTARPGGVLTGVCGGLLALRASGSRPADPADTGTGPVLGLSLLQSATSFFYSEGAAEVGDGNPCLLPEMPNTTGWHAHIPYAPGDPAEAKAAAALAKELGLHFHVACGAGGTQDTEYRKAGSSMHSAVIGADPSEWLTPRVGNLSVFVHPVTGCFKVDHLVWGRWLGHSRFTNGDLTSTSRWGICDQRNYPGCTGDVLRALRAEG